MLHHNRIIVTGAGHGGLVAAMKLAKNGFDVTVFEKNDEKDLGHDQSDFFDIEAMHYAGIPVPKEYIRQRIPLSCYAKDRELEPISQIVSEEQFSLCADRRELLKYLISLARAEGVKFVFNCEIFAPVMLGSRVAGIDTAMGRIYADLIIDSAGIHSPLRRNMPEFTHIQREIGMFDILHTYRGYYNRIPYTKKPKTPYSIYLWDDGTRGFSWLISTDPNEVDFLLCRFDKIEKNEIESILGELRELNPHLGQTLMRGGNEADIPVRAPLSVLIADGYAAIGDSAFMTVAYKGSGIAACIKAGTILARAVSEDKDGLFDRKSLWRYQNDFFLEIGFDLSVFALGKNILPFITADDINYLYREKILSQDDARLFSSGSNIRSIISDAGISYLTSKARQIIDRPEIRKKIMDFAKWISRVKLIQSAFPSKYDEAELYKWAARYDSFFESIKRQTKDDGRLN